MRLGYRKELEAETDPEAKQALFEKLLANFYDTGKALNYAMGTEIDAVIDPMDTRRWIVNAALAAPVVRKGSRGFIDTW